MKDLGFLNYFLGLKVTTRKNGFYLSQTKYVFDLLACAWLIDSEVTSTSLEYNVKFTPTDDVLLDDPTLYHQLVGGLVYLIVTHPKIAYTIHIISQFMIAP